MERPIITSFSKIAPIITQKYERYIPTANDESLTLLEKVNKVIIHLNQIGSLSNDLNEQWLAVMDWVMNGGISEAVIDRLDEMANDGTLDEIINDHLFSELNAKIDSKASQVDLTNLDTELTNAMTTLETETDAALLTKTTNGLKINEPMGGRSPKVVYQSTDPNTMIVVTKKPNDGKYLLHYLKSGVFTQTNSVGQKSEFLRHTRVHELLDCVVYRHSRNGYGSTDGFGEFNIDYPDYVFNSQRSMKAWRNNSSTSTLASDFLQFDLAVKEDGKFNIAFYMSASSTTAAKVKVDGVVIDTINLSSTINRIFVKEFQTTPGTHDVRIEVGEAQKFLYVIGLNFYHLKDWKGETCDEFAYWQTSDAYIYNDGASDYAIVDADTGLYCGSYHGGETSKIKNTFYDGKNMTLAEGTLRVCYGFKVIQQTDIVEKLTSQTQLTFDLDGVVDFKAVMKGNINVSTFYTCMTTTSDSFNQIYFPIVYTVNTGDEIDLGRVNTVQQRNSSTNQMLTTNLTLFDNDFNAKGGAFVRNAEGAYNKLYYGYAVYSPTPVNIKNIAFQTTRIYH